MGSKKGECLKSPEDFQKEIENACDSRFSVDTYHLARANRLLGIIAEIQVEILREIKAGPFFRQSQQQDQQGKGRHK
jgi:hypothetical protein